MGKSDWGLGTGNAENKSVGVLSGLKGKKKILDSYRNPTAYFWPCPGGNLLGLVVDPKKPGWDQDNPSADTG